MEDFIYEESDYIKRQDLKEYTDLMIGCDFQPEEISDSTRFNQMFQYLVNLTEKAPDFLKPYEHVLLMISYLEENEELLTLKKITEVELLKACYRIADKHDVFNKKIEWGWHENRPLIRGLYSHADSLWKQGDLKASHELFSKILKTNENDNIGARYSVKATKEGLNHQEFEERFTYSDEYGSYYKNKELAEWFEE